MPMQRCSLSRLERHLASTYAVQEHLASRVETVIGFADISTSTTRKIELSLDAEVATQVLPSGSPIQPLNEYGEVPSTNGTAISSAEASGNLSEHQSVTSSCISTDPAGALTCNCECQSESLYTSPWMLRSIIGHFEMRCSRRLSACNQSGCRKLESNAITIGFHPPPSLWRRYVVLKVQNSPYEGAQVFLRMPRIMSWSHQLWYFVKLGQIDAVTELFSKGVASPFDVTEKGGGALMSARNNIEVTRLLLREKADPYKPNTYGRTAAELLWERAYSGKFGEGGPFEVAKMLQESDYLEMMKFNNLHKIVLGQSSAKLNDELEEGNADIDDGDSKGRTPLRWAVIRDDIDLIKILLAKGADPNVKDIYGNMALDFVQSTDSCRMLLLAGATISNRNFTHGRTPLHYFDHLCPRSMMNPHNHEIPGIIHLLVEAGMDVNVRDWVGETPLLRAVFEGMTEAVASLLSHGADTDFTNTETGNNALHIAVNYNQHESARLLLDHCIDYTGTSKRGGNNIAHLAAIHGDTLMIRILHTYHLCKLDFGIRNDDDKLPSDLMAERMVFYEAEIGIHEAFDAWAASVAALRSSMSIDNEVHEIVDFTDDASLPEDQKTCRLPGSFPS